MFVDGHIRSETRGDFGIPENNQIDWMSDSGMHICEKCTEKFSAYQLKFVWYKDFAQIARIDIVYRKGE